MAQIALQHADLPMTLTTSYYSPTAAPSPSSQLTDMAPPQAWNPFTDMEGPWGGPQNMGDEMGARGLDLGATGRGILIGMLSAFGSALLFSALALIIYFLRFTNRGRILLDRFSRPGEFDDEQQYLREEEDAMAEMDDLQRAEYLRAKAFVHANPPESVHTDISLSQFLAIQEKGVSAWEFEPELEIANCFVEARTEIEFFDSECSVQSNLPMPKQNEVYYWEAKIYDKPETTYVSIGVTTKPYPLFRLPGYHKYSVAYTSTGQRRFNQPFNGTTYGPAYVQGDVIGIGYRPRSGTIFFTRNGKKLEDVAHGLKLHNFFPTVGANGPCTVHVNFGQMGFVFIEANVKKWGLAPMTGSLAPPPPYGSEAGSILLEGGRESVREGQGWIPGHGRMNSATLRLQARSNRSPGGPERSPTAISLAQLNLMDYQDEPHADIGEGRSTEIPRESPFSQQRPQQQSFINPGLPLEPAECPPPEYESPIDGDGDGDGRDEDEDDDDDSDSTPRASTSSSRHGDRRPLLGQPSPPIPSYEAAVSDAEAQRGRSMSRGDDSRPG